MALSSSIKSTDFTSLKIDTQDLSLKGLHKLFIKATVNKSLTNNTATEVSSESLRFDIYFTITTTIMLPSISYTIGTDSITTSFPSLTTESGIADYTLVVISKTPSDQFANDP